jgi:hypothetical protein
MDVSMCSILLISLSNCSQPQSDQRKGLAKGGELLGKHVNPIQVTQKNFDQAKETTDEYHERLLRFHRFCIPAAGFLPAGFVRDRQDEPQTDKGSQE